MKLELTKDIPKDAFVFSGVASREIEDDDGDIILLKGMDFSRFIKNPSIKRDHSINSDDAVGKAISLEIIGKELKFEAFVSSTEKKLIQKMKEGIVQDFSIGFLPLERDKNNPKIISKSRLYEITITGLGCNEDSKVEEIFTKSNLNGLSFKKFHINMEDIKKTAQAVVEESAEKVEFSKQEVEKMVTKAVSNALENKSAEKIELEKKEWKEERDKTMKNSSLSVKSSDFSNLDKKEQKKQFYSKMFKHFANKNNEVGSRTLLELKSMTGAVDGSGGYTIPTPLASELLTDVMNEAVMLPLVNTMMTSARSLDIPIQEIATPKPSTTEEGQIKPESDGTFRMVSIKVWKIACKTFVTDELIEDSEYDIIRNTINVLHQNAALEIDTQILTGTGDANQKMEGIMTNVSVPSIDMTNEEFDGILEGVDTLPVRYRKVRRQKSLDSRGDMLAFVMPTSAKTFFRTLKALDGRYYWSEPVAGAEYPTLDGYPVIEVDNSFLPANSMLFGNFKKGYTAIIKNGGTIAQSMHFKFDQDMQTLRFVARVGGKVIDPNAFVIFENIGVTTP